MQAHNLPGASLAIAHNGSLVTARGYGIADSSRGHRVSPTSTFRVGSIGKTITAIAVMKLVEDGKLDLDAPAFALLPSIRPLSGRLGDARIPKITIRNLLSHSGGWDASVSGEPVISPLVSKIAAATGGTFPPAPESIIAWMLDQRLDFDPGTRFAYSNFGFVVLGRVIEAVSGQLYDQFVKQQILAPMGIERMALGRTPLALRAANEVYYFDYPGAPLVTSLMTPLMPGIGGLVPEPYSGMLPFESIDSAGAWIASSVDIARIFAMLDGKLPVILSSASIQQMVTPAFGPIGTDASGTPNYISLGIAIKGSGADAEWWHDGGTWGSHAFAARFRDGWTWAAIFNSAPWDTIYTASGGPTFEAALQDILSVDALELVKWPSVDLFPMYLETRPSPNRPNQAPR